MRNPIDVLEAVVGSHAYGMATEDSDVDTMAIHIQPTLDLCGLQKPPADTIRHGADDGEPDYVSHEIGKYLQLAAGGNPTVTELLWVENHTIYTSWVANWLLDMRGDLLSQLCKDRYLGYATQQFKKLMREGRFGNGMDKRGAKNARHLVRLIQQGSHLWSTGELKLKVDDPDELRSIGDVIATTENGQFVAEQWLKYGEEQFAKPSPLPAEPNLERISAFLDEVRKQYTFM